MPGNRDQIQNLHGVYLVENRGSAPSVREPRGVHTILGQPLTNTVNRFFLHGIGLKQAPITWAVISKHPLQDDDPHRRARWGQPCGIM